MTENLAFDMGLRKGSKKPFSMDYSAIGDRLISVGGNGKTTKPSGTQQSSVVGGKGESLGVSSQKPITGKLITGEMGTVAFIEKCKDK